LQGPWTDIYAVGATLYRAISGRPPMDSSRRGALGDELKPVTEMTTTDYRAGFMAAIDLALRLKPDERPQCIADWRTMLTDAAPMAGAALPRAPVEPTPQALPRGAAATGISGGSALADSVERRPDPTSTFAARRRGSLVTGLAVAAIATAGAVAYWRSASAPPSTTAATASQSVAAQPTEPGPALSPVAVKPPVSKPPGETPIAPIVTPPDAEQIAETAWRSLSASTDTAAIERFIADHGATRLAASARARLTTLRDEQARNAAAAARSKEVADEAARQRARDANWSACQAAPDSEKAARCSVVANSDDIPARRAAAFHQQGLAERRLGHYDKAVAELTRALDLAPTNAQVLNDRGIAYFLKGDPASREGAMRDYDAAIRNDPNHAEALNNRAWSLFQAGRASEALADADRSIAANPANGYAYDTRGQILESLGRRDDAIRDYQRAIAIDTTQETSRAALARLRPQSR
jgi:tetratricopeptide (TPR) repeat protein